MGLNYNFNSPFSSHDEEIRHSFHCRIKLMKAIKIEHVAKLLSTTLLFSAVSALPELAGRHK